MSLSPQQIQAAELIARGYSHQEVGDAVGVSRRTILRWLKLEDFKNLSYGLVGRASASASPTLSQRPSERCPQQSSGLTPQDLVDNALEAVRDILQDPDSRNADKLKASALVGEWAGLGQQKTKMAEMEALKILCESGWVPDEVLRALCDGHNEMSERVAAAFYGCFRLGRPEEPEKKPNPPPWPRDPWS